MKSLRKYLHFTLVLYIVIGCSAKQSSNSYLPNYSDTSTLNKEDKGLKRVWDQFKSAVLTKNLRSLNSLAANCIYCSRCSTFDLSDTSKSQENVPIVSKERFIKENFDKIFNDPAKKFYFDDANIWSISWVSSKDFRFYDCLGTVDKAKVQVFEVALKDKRCSGEECGETFFSFLNTGSGYKLYEVYDVP
jgi:hypothetical protein